jgi:hypothetical protein
MRGKRETEGRRSRFGRKKEAAIAALLTQRNVEEAARVAEVGTQTLYRWMKEPEFQAAMSTLLRIMVDLNVPASIRARGGPRLGARKGWRRE